MADRILVFEDNDLERDVMSVSLRSLGFEVVALASAVDCVSQIQIESPALVLMDLMMPDLHGISALKLIRERWSQMELPVIIVTASPEDCDLLKALREGANDYIAKPISIGIAAIRIQNHLTLSRLSKVSTTLLQTLPVGVVTIDRETRIIESANEHMKTLLGANVSAIIGNQCHSQLCGTNEGVCPVFELGLSIENSEKLMIRRDGSTIPVMRTAAPVNINGREKILECFVDISERKTHEQARTQLQRQLFHSQRLAAIGVLAAGVGHEINNPLAIISGYIEMMESELLGDPIFSKAIVSIQAAVDRVKVIVDGLRSFARADSSRDEVFDFHKAISDTVDLLATMYGRQGIKIELRLQASRAEVSGNLGRVQQVVMNLLSNARDAISPNSGTITIETDLIDNNSTFMMRCNDTGCGISEEDIHKIFDSFYTTKELGKGTGLGLSISHGIVTSMNGQIGVESKIGVGTCFSIRVPLALTPASILAEKQCNLGGRRLYQGRRVLVVEDEDAIREVVRLLLERVGFVVDEATDGLMAMQKLSKNQYEVVITDLNMPKVTGEELLVQVRNSGKTVPVVLMTGGVITEISSEDHKKLEELADGYLRKPFGKEELFKVLQNIFLSPEPVSLV